ncbi:hypothetical protein EON63_18325 [archaeon]|nr:MAG: hypothetical protein EON63_18325 [archaeon]
MWLQSILVIVLCFVVCTKSYAVLRPTRCKMIKSTFSLPHTISSCNSKSLQTQHTDQYFTEYDKYGTERLMQFDPITGLFRPVQQDIHLAHTNTIKLAPFLLSSFIPTGDLSPDYYRFSTWRVIQRLIGSTNNVFGTQALLLALGLKKDKIGLAAASSWVLKDALGKVSRIIFASKYGRRFDVDTKKWRFRAALLYSTGTALEILTFLFPSCFIVSAAIATAFKQMAMLSNSSTRNAM